MTSFLATITTNLVITVVGTPIIEHEEVTPDGAEVCTVGEKQLDRLSAQDIQTALRHVPGVAISRFSPIGSFGGSQGGAVYVRGTGVSRPGGELTVLRDGIPAMGSFFNHPLMDLTPIDFASSVSVVKTPRPRTIPNAFSAVELNTYRREEEGYGGTAHVAFGRFDTFISSAMAGVKEGAFDVAAGAVHRQSEGAREHGAARLDGAFARAGVDLGETEYLTFVYHFSDSSVEDPGEYDKPTPRYERFETKMNSYLLRLETMRESVEGASTIYFTDGRIDWRKDHFMDANPNSPWGYSRTDWATFGYRGLYDLKFGDFTGSLGLDVMDEEGRSRAIRGSDGFVAPMPVPTWEREIFTAPYVGARYDFKISDDWTFKPSAGTRYYFHNVYHGELAPHAGFDLGTDEYGFFASYQRGVHYPGLVFVANRDKWETHNRRAEKMDNFNLGIRAGDDESWQAKLSAFYNHVTDRLDQDRYGRYHNAGELNVAGVEGSLRLQPTEDLSLMSAVAINAPAERRVSRMPRWTLTQGVSYRFLTYWRIDIDAEYVAKMYAYSVRSQEVDDLKRVSDYWTLNARLSLDMRACLPMDGEWYVAAENLLDRRYEYFPGYEMPGIMIYFGMKLRF